MRASFVINEVGIGLKRNLTLTIAAVVTTAVSLALLGAGLLVRQQVARINDLYYGKLEVAIFLKADVSQPQRDALLAELNKDPLVKNSKYETKEEAYRRFLVEEKDTPDVASTVTAADLPESYRVQLNDPKQYTVIAARYKAEAGVDQVQDYKRFLQPIFKLLDGIKRAAYIVALFQVLAATLLIYNTIRVSAFGRRKETGIMRLVGATAFSIQLPFLVEGAVAGLVGGALACAALATSKSIIIDNLTQSVSARILPPLQWSDIVGTMPLLLVVGVTISSLASFITLRRFLRV
jgi:cell division transport system permease protein